jgi:hypothetical protein
MQVLITVVEVVVAAVAVAGAVLVAVAVAVAVTMVVVEAAAEEVQRLPHHKDHWKTTVGFIIFIQSLCTSFPTYYMIGGVCHTSPMIYRLYFRSHGGRQEDGGVCQDQSHYIPINLSRIDDNGTYSINQDFIRSS